jgi:uncharacterized membrane protein YhiD involved in acid resistance
MLYGVGVSLEANGWFLGVAGFVVVAVFILFFHRETKLTTKLGSIETTTNETAVAVEQVNRQVNHVEDPDREPKLRDVVLQIHEMLCVMRIDAAVTSQHAKETRQLLDRHLSAHQAEHERGT